MSRSSVLANASRISNNGQDAVRAVGIACLVTCFLPRGGLDSFKVFGWNDDLHEYDTSCIFWATTSIFDRDV